MKEMMQRVLGTLRSAFQGSPEVREVSCLVPECKTSPSVVLAGTENGVLAGCQEHARRWVTSDACRLAAVGGAGNVVEALEQWAEEHGTYATLAVSRPRNDIALLGRDLSQGFPSP
jgi:hypothetical protein